MEAPSVDELSTRYNPNIPIQYQIFLDLQKQMEDGYWVGRDDFPGAKELAESYGVGKITAERALERLVDAGWILRSRGRRPQVLRGPSEPITEMPGLLRTGKSRPFAYELLRSGIDVAPTESCRAFGLDPGSTTWTLRRLRRWKSEPHSITYNVQDPSVGEAHQLRGLKSKPMLGLLAAQGLAVARATRQMGLQRASNFEAQALEVPLGTATLAATFTMFAVDGRVIQWVRIQLHPDVRTPIEEIDLESGAGWTSDENL
ncbi:MAG: GntR family transcriptional regulator [Acidimicrobiales bacterium]